MSSEVEWRRKWKPTLTAYPWQPIKIHGTVYMIKYKFTPNSYELLLTDLKHFWYEELAENKLQKRVKKLNPGIEAPLTRILDQIKSVLDKTQEDPNTAIKISFQTEAGSLDVRALMSLTSQLAGLPFSWNFHCLPAEQHMGSEHLTLPLMAMVSELSRRQRELFKVVQAKDKEIEDYKGQGTKVSRKHIETPKFVETAFEMSMMTSKGFEDQMRNFELDTFNGRGQDLYRQIMTKQAWVHSPTKGMKSDDDSLLDDMSSSEDRKASTGDSWGNSRLPPSLQQSRSPNKAPSPNKTPSPTKTSNNSTPESSPVKGHDSELLRRQALERRLEEEEAKKMEKARKKKKIAF